MTKEKISDEIICRVFAQYYKAPIAICEPNIEPVSHYLEGVDFCLNKILAERVSYDPQWIKLILKPLLQITEEDAFELATICQKYIYGQSGSNFKYVMRDAPNHVVICENTKKQGKHIYAMGAQIIVQNDKILFDNGEWYENNERTEIPFEAYQFLQEKHYDIRQYLLGGKTLFECDLAIYK